MMINASAAKQLSDDANRYDVYRKIADAKIGRAHV